MKAVIVFLALCVAVTIAAPVEEHQPNVEESLMSADAEAKYDYENPSGQGREKRFVFVGVGAPIAYGYPYVYGYPYAAKTVVVGK